VKFRVGGIQKTKQGGAAMKKKFFTGAVIGFCILIITGFSSFASAQEYKWPPLFRIGTSGTQGSTFAPTNGWGAKFGETMGTKVRIIPEDSEVRRYVRFTENKEFELNVITVSDLSYAIQGMIAYAEKRCYPVRTVWHQADTPWGFVVRGDSNIKTIYDLKRKGIRFGLAIGQPPMVTAVKEALPAFLGWTKEEAEKNWTFVPASSYTENCRAVTDGKADVSYASPLSAVLFEMEAHPAKIRWLDMPHKDKAGWNRWLKIRPILIPTKVEIGAPSANGLEGLTSNFLYWVRADTDQEMVYQLAKWFHQSFDKYKDTHTLNKRMELRHFRNYLNHACLPVAEGTIRYLKEIGQWSEADDKWNNEAIALMDRWVKARNAALDEAKAKGVKIHWENKDYLAILEKHTKDFPVFTARIE
jgi:TRAP transporter TAXI family solute receptor